jgi:acetyl esterase/lipase
MIYQHINHTEKFDDSRIEAYIHEPYAGLRITKRKAIVVCPGGGYGGLSEREGEPVALQYFAAGLNAFVLRYSVAKKAENYAPLIEACLAIKYIRDHAEELHIDPNYVFITGFSAGGHLAAWTGTMWHIPEVQAYLDGADSSVCKPTATLPCYPVISSLPGVRHDRTMKTLNGGKPNDEEGMARFSIDRFVDEKTSPAFIWHTTNDACVSVMNSIIYAEALSKNKIPFELHIFPDGPHGLSLCNAETSTGQAAWNTPYVGQWLPMAIRFVTECPFEKMLK